MKSIFIFSVIVIGFYSCSGNGQSKVDPEAIYKQKIEELEYGNICCENMIGYCAVENYDAAIESFVKPSKYDAMGKSIVSNDSMIVLYKKYFPSIDSALKAEDNPNGFSEYDKKMLDIFREHAYNVHKINFDTQRKLGQ
jgi:hypothetical protein